MFYAPTTLNFNEVVMFRDDRKKSFPSPSIRSLEKLEDRLVLAGNYLGTPFEALPVVGLVDPTTVEAERFDRGGNGVGYVDLDGRLGLGTYRPGEAVDIWIGTTDGAEGSSVFDFRAGESMNYSVSVPEHGSYDFTFRVASPANAGTVGGYFHVEASSADHPDDSPERSPLVIVPGTGSLTAWSDVTVRGVHLHEGLNVIKLVSDFGSVSVDYFKVQKSQDVHVGNNSSATEHHQLDDLLPAGNATNVAIQSGNWSNPSTWSFSRVPTAGAKVWVPEGVTLTYDVDSTTPIDSIRVDGTFSYATDRNTRLFVDTIGVMPKAKYIQGTAANPIPASIKSSVIFTDSGPIDRTNDPTELGRGLISHGEVSINGAEKVTQGWLATNPRAGDQAITLAAAPTGWRVGDEIIVAGVQSRELTNTPVPTADTPQYARLASQDEVRIVTAIVGNQVTLDRALAYDHLPPANQFDAQGNPLRVYVANTTRSISYRSANTDYSNNAVIHRHGHVMFMHSDKVTVNYAEFRDLGRTNKAISIDDVMIEPTSNQQTKFTPGTGTNVRGRYALHFHKTGVNGQGSPVVVRGNSVIGGPGWGYVNHQSYVEFYDNVAYNVPGASFVEEDGTGIGSFRRNISIASLGTGRSQTFNEDGDLRDMGFLGHGFFFRGNATIAEDNVALSSAHSGYAWSNKGEVRVAVNDLTIPSMSLLDPQLTLGGNSLAWEAVPTKFFRRNVAAASTSAIAAGFWMQPASTQHDGRNEIRDFTGWNLVGPEAARIQYTRGLTWINVRLSRDASLATRGETGIRTEVNATGDHVYDNVRVTGYNVGLFTRPVSNGLNQRFLIINNSDFTTGNGQALVDPTNVLTIPRSGNTGAGPLDFVGTAENVPYEGGINVGLYVSGTKTDSLGTETIGGRGSSNARFYVGGQQLKEIIARGYYTDAAGPFVIIPILVTDRLTLDTKVVGVRAGFTPSSFTTTPIGPNWGTLLSLGGRALRQINAGGPTTAGFTADAGFSGGTVISTTQTVNNSGVFGSVVPSIYQTARIGASTYTVTGLAANTVYTVSLQFAEIENMAVGKRQFGVKINGASVLENFDIVSVVGVPFRAVVRQFTATSDATGVIRIEFLNGPAGQPLISGIQILDQIASLVTTAPLVAPGSGSFTEPQVVTLSSPTPNSTIYYTLDGSDPTTQSIRYTKPFVVNQTTTVRSIAVSTGRRTSEISTTVLTIQPPATPYRINFGGGAVGGFSADLYSTGYLKSLANTRPINVSAAGAGPAAIYQSANTIWADYDMWTVLPNLTPGKTYTLRLHFAEPTYTLPGERRFDVWVNGQKRLNALDVVAEAGGRDIALVKELSFTADKSGRLYLFLEGSNGAYNRSVLLNALEVLDPAP